MMNDNIYNILFVAIAISCILYDSGRIASLRWIGDSLAQMCVELRRQPYGQLKGELIGSLVLRIGTKFSQIRGNRQVFSKL